MQQVLGEHVNKGAWLASASVVKIIEKWWRNGRYKDESGLIFSQQAAGSLLREY